MFMRALITGIGGQDGTLLKSILLQKNFAVFGVLRPKKQIELNWKNSLIRSLIEKNQEIDIEIDLSDSKLCNTYLNITKPDRIFHLAAVHAPAIEMKSIENRKSHDMYKCHVAITQNLMEWVKLNKQTRIVVALTSQMYSPSKFFHKITENNSTLPQNLYAKTKLEGFTILKKYRQEFGLFANGLILFNHTSAIAKPNYLFSEIARQIVEFKNKEKTHITIQNALQKIDMCDASEVCDAMYRAIESDFPKDYIISSGKLKSIESIIVEAAHLLKIELSKKNIISLQKQKKSNYTYGDPTKAFRELGWRATKTPAQILGEMVSFYISNGDSWNKNI